MSGIHQPFPDSQNNPLIFITNGWQSWSHSGIDSQTNRMVRSKLGLLQESMVINTGTPILRERGSFSSDFFGVLGRRDKLAGLLFGFLSQTQHFGTIVADLGDKPSLSMWANCDTSRLEPGAEGGG